MPKKHINPKEIYYLALLLTCTIPWIIFQIGLHIPSDAIFLFLSMQMLIDGKLMSEYFYDNNPPMSFLIYAPAAFLHIAGLSKHLAFQLYIMGFSLISVIITYYLLGKWKNLPITPKFIFLSCYICAITLIAYIEYGQKDHLIEIALIPFLLMQISITKKHNVPPCIYWIISILYVPFILLKPHFGLLPTCIILYRLYINKNLSALLKADFITLALGTISYIIFIFIVTPDFITEILPTSLSYYVTGQLPESNFYKNSFAVFILTTMIAIIAGLNEDKSESKKIALIFSILSMISVIPFFVQGKGFSLHLLPTICFVYIGATLTLYLYLNKNRLANNLKLTPYIFIIAIYALSYLYIYWGNPVITANQYKKLSLAKLIKSEAGTEPFFIETYSTNIIMTTAFYTGNKFASRFPSLWFAEKIDRLPEKNKQQSWNKFSIMMVEDFKRYSPQLMAFIKNNPNLINALNNNNEFNHMLTNNYQYKGEYKLLKSEYINFYSRDTPDEIIYDIYTRKKQQ